MATTIFLQNEIFTKFLFPFLLMFFVVFAVLERTKLFGAEKKQLNALTSFVVALIFVTAIFPKVIVENLILFLTVAIVAIFVILLIWGFIFGDEKGFALNNKLKWILGIGAGIAFFAALIWATGWYPNLVDFFSNSGLNSTIITNATFIIVIAIALALIIGKAPKK
ncbi:MAG: hypothetical protein AABX99_01985 [Nanoarchaeota archaeon]